MMKKAGSFFKTPVHFYQTARCNIPEDSNLHSHGLQNLTFQTQNYAAMCNSLDPTPGTYTTRSRITTVESDVDA
jgi:hypothetical protein